MEFAILCFKLGIINSGLKAGAKWLNLHTEISAVNSRVVTHSKLGLVESPPKRCFGWYWVARDETLVLFIYVSLISRCSLTIAVCTKIICRIILTV